jgi:sec-independent protein translocase protein TatB
MFDVSWSEIMVIGVVALLVVGPKELPALLRTVGKYIGAIKRQASEFRAQFDEAMRESELDQIKKDIENVGRDMEETVREAERSVETEMADAKREFDSAGEAAASAAEAPAAGARELNGSAGHDHGLNGASEPAAPKDTAAPLPDSQPVKPT